MQTTAPGQTTIITESGLPSGATVGFQVLKATTGTVTAARSTVGVIERPSGSGNYVINFIAPIEGDLYLVVVDWTAGVLAPETTRITDLNVTTEVQPGSGGLGAIADYVHMYLGGELWKGLNTSLNYGPDFIQRAIDIVKRRAMKYPPDIAGEAALDPLVLAYLGICGALELVPAARDWAGSLYTSVSTGDDPTEIVTYVNRAKLVDDLRDDLMRRLAAALAAALPLIDQPVLQLATGMPAIDEADDCKVTSDPRDFPSFNEFAGRVAPIDAFGYPVRSGVRL